MPATELKLKHCPVCGALVKLHFGLGLVIGAITWRCSDQGCPMSDEDRPLIGWNGPGCSCPQCEHFDPIATVTWRECCHPERYTIKPVEVAARENVMFDPSLFINDTELPENYTDHGCPLGGE